MFFCVFCVFGSYLGDLCYSISAKNNNFAVEMRKCKIKKMKRLLILFFALSTMTLMAQTPINIIIGSKTFTATLADSETGEAFAALLPLTITMNELNGNEKYHYLSSSLPTAAYQPGTIHAGDLMLYGNNCVVLFYETFNTSYSYTRLGAIDNPSGLSPADFASSLASALGSGDVSVRFELTSTATENLTPNVQSDDVQSTKVIENGVLYIKHNGVTYNVQGVKVNVD